jgi:hypothetical protein
MLILWIRKKQRDNSENLTGKNNGSFKKHDEEMKIFRQGHPDKGTADLVEFITPDGGLLAPVVSAKPGDNTQN